MTKKSQQMLRKFFKKSINIIIALKINKVIITILIGWCIL